MMAARQWAETKGTTTDDVTGAFRDATLLIRNHYGGDFLFLKIFEIQELLMVGQIVGNIWIRCCCARDRIERRCGGLRHDGGK